MLRRLTPLGIALLVAFSPAAPLPASAASPHVWRVGTFNGIAGEFTTIQAAVDHAAPGDWILVAPGDYHEKGSNDPAMPAGVMVRKAGLHLRGMDRNHTVVDGTLAGAPGPCSALAAFQDLGPLDASGVPAGRSGIWVDKASGVYVECQSAVSIPMFRLVQFQLERAVREDDHLPAAPRTERTFLPACASSAIA